MIPIKISDKKVSLQFMSDQLFNTSHSNLRIFYFINTRRKVFKIGKITDWYVAMVAILYNLNYFHLEMISEKKIWLKISTSEVCFLDWLLENKSTGSLMVEYSLSGETAVKSFKRLNNW